MPKSKTKSKIKEWDAGYLEECIASNDKRALLIFLMQSIDTTVLRLNKFKGCIELYPNVPDLEDQLDEEE